MGKLPDRQIQNAKVPAGREVTDFNPKLDDGSLPLSKVTDQSERKSLLIFTKAQDPSRATSF